MSISARASVPARQARTLSDTVESASITTEAVIHETLLSIAAMLGHAADTPHIRELRAKARSYERIVQQWKGVAPSNAQRDATLDLVVELRTKVAEVAGGRSEG